MLRAYKKFWQGYTDFHGKTGRKDYWLAALINAIPTAVLVILNKLNPQNTALMVLEGLFVLAIFLPSLAIGVRRLNDAGDGWKNIFWVLLPVAGAIVLLIKFCKPTAAAKNEPVRPAPAPAPAGQSAAAAQQTQHSVSDAKRYLLLADKYAHVESLFGENPEKKQLEAQLLAGGKDAQEGIFAYLILCAYGKAQYGWWNGAAGLTCMIRKIDRETAEDKLQRLTQIQTNIWEYHTQVIETAQKQLLELKKESGGYGADGLIPAEFAHAELLNLQNVGEPKDRLQKAFTMMKSAEAWPDTEKAFLYFIAGGAARVLYPENHSNLAFYAAQVRCDPNSTSMGWSHLRETEGASLPATAESARLMSEKYPLPKDMEEAEHYTPSAGAQAEPQAETYTLEQGLSDLTALFRSYPQLDREKIREVGQKIYDANIPLVSGVGGMHQLYARFKQSMPMYGAALSRIWDGIGDWAD